MEKETRSATIKVKLSDCGCGGAAKIVQEEYGTPYFDYSGETFHIECTKCHISIPKELNNLYYDELMFLSKSWKIIKSQIKKWNRAFKNAHMREHKFKIT